MPLNKKFSGNCSKVSAFFGGIKKDFAKYIKTEAVKAIRLFLSTNRPELMQYKSGVDADSR
jgi:hypothetical protein